MVRWMEQKVECLMVLEQELSKDWCPCLVQGKPHMDFLWSRMKRDSGQRLVHCPSYYKHWAVGASKPDYLPLASGIGYFPMLEIQPQLLHVRHTFLALELNLPPIHVSQQESYH
jgi:hypothetical protein